MRARLVVVRLVLPLAIAFPVVAAPAVAAPRAGSQSVAPPPASYAGDAACLSCHDTKSHKGTAHANAQNPRTPAATHGCESCHGAGKAHVDGGDAANIRNPASLPVKESIAVCAACHDGARHPAAVAGQPPAPDAGCTWCHSVHKATAPKLLKRAP